MYLQGEANVLGASHSHIEKANTQHAQNGQ